MATPININFIQSGSSSSLDNSKNVLNKIFDSLENSFQNPLKKPCSGGGASKCGGGSKAPSSCCSGGGQGGEAKGIEDLLGKILQAALFQQIFSGSSGNSRGSSLF